MLVQGKRRVFGMIELEIMPVLIAAAPRDCGLCCRQRQAEPMRHNLRGFFRTREVRIRESHGHSPKSAGVDLSTGPDGAIESEPWSEKSHLPRRLRHWGRSGGGPPME